MYYKNHSEELAEKRAERMTTSSLFRALTSILTILSALHCSERAQNNGGIQTLKYGYS
jgi:hypothetical protein